MSVGFNTEAPQMPSYTDIDGKVIATNRGPLCGDCGKPYRRGVNPAIECQCVALPPIPGDRNEAPPIRQATALELIAFHLSKLVKLLESKEVVQGVVEVPSNFTVPGVTTVGDMESIKAKGEAAKAATLERLKGGLAK